MENYAIDNLNTILSLDEVIYKRLYELGGGTVNALVSQQVIDKLREERRLDKPPGNLKLNTKGIESGCKVIFKYAYRAMRVDNEDVDTGTIKIVNNEVSLSLEVFKVMKTLIQVGTCKNPDLSDACKHLFMEIVRIYATTGKTVDRHILKERLHANGYYEEQLVSAIWEELDDEQP